MDVMKKDMRREADEESRIEDNRAEGSDTSRHESA
jgi:hypothetical protein